MASFWKWGICSPALLLALVSVASGATGVVDWSAALAATLGCAVVGDVAYHLGRRAAERARRRNFELVVARHKAVLREKVREMADPVDLERAA